MTNKYKQDKPYTPYANQPSRYHPITEQNKPKRSKLLKRTLLAFVLILIAGALYSFHLPDKEAIYVSAINKQVKTNHKKVESKTEESNECSGNTLDKDVVVIISKQHLWACQYNLAVYNSPVVTGYAHYASDITPVGTYHIYKKYTNVELTGSDQLGSWNVHVSYWMPFLFNQYGAYGLHDANWVKPSEFGHISPNSKKASHGCVELPLATAQWLYGWLNVGSTVTIKAA